jgi:hypothetical protein
MSRILNLNSILVVIVVVLLVVALSGLKTTGETNLRQAQQTSQCFVDEVLGGCR